MILQPSPYKWAVAIAYMAVLSLLTAPPSHAQIISDIFKVSDSQNETFANIGVATATRNPYLGADSSDVLVLPFVNAEYKGHFYIKPALGAGVNLINTDALRLSTGANLALGRSDTEIPLLQGTEEVKTSIVINSNARILLPFGALDILGHVPVTGGLNGARLDVLLSTEIKPVPKLRITPGVRATYYTQGWLNPLYGINAEQSQVSGLAPVTFGSELATLGVHSAAYLQIASNYEIIGAFNYSQLVGDVKNSPLTPQNHGLTAALGIARKF